MSAKSIFINIAVICVLFSTAAAQAPVEQTPFWSTSELGIYSTGMVWRDANNDGYIDVFFSNGNDMNLARNTVYLSQYGVMPASASWYSNNYEYSGHCGVGDIDDDGWADFLVANYLGAGRFTTGNYGNLYLNNETDFLSIWPDWYNADSIYSFSCALGDADGDGDLDAAFATGEGYNGIYENDLVFYNDGGALNTSPGWQSAYATAALDVAWGDVNNDGWLDLAFCYSDGAPATLYYNNAGTIEITPSWQSNYSEPSNSLIFGDVNGDGWLDLILADNNQLGGTGRFRVYFNDGAGNLDPEYGWQSGQGGYGSALALYDYDNDGDDDLATGRWFNRLNIYENTGTTFSTSPIWESGLSIVAEELAWIDIDGDGVEQRRDVFTASGGKKLFYTTHHPLQAIDSVVVDGTVLADEDFCYDLFYGWVSLGSVPTDSVEIFYQYSFKCDLTVANWDTCNMAFANTNRPMVDMYAEPSVGWAPLTVQFFDSTESASDWLWQFSETDSTTIQNPERTYTTGGLYDVYLENTQPDGRHNRLAKNMVIALADTLAGTDAEGSSGTTVEVTINVTNNVPLYKIQLPLEFEGLLELSYQGYSRAGCRTEDFDHIDYINYDGNNKRFYMEIDAGSAPLLQPGTGPIIKFSFEITAGEPGDTNLIVFDGYNAYEPGFVGYLLEYQPALEEIAIAYSGCCVSFTGNADCSEIEEPDISDITRLIDFLYLSHAPLCCPEEADADGSGGEPDISDITRLIDYLYLSHDPLIDCP